MRITTVKFTNFKALRRYSLYLQDVNILVGPNNCGKSTVLSGFRVLEYALRTAKSKKATRVTNADGHQSYGHNVPEAHVPISLENVHTDYSDAPSHIEFKLTNKNTLTLYFPESGGCVLYWDALGKTVATPSAFVKHFPINIQVIPVLGPIEQEEIIVTDETVRRAAGTPRASRHFRNYWRKNPDGFSKFKSLIEDTWPGMSIKPPELTSVLGPHRSPARRIDGARIPPWVAAALMCAQQGCRSLRSRHEVGAAALGAAFFGVLASDRQPPAKAAHRHRVAALNLQAMRDAAAVPARRAGISRGGRAPAGRRGCAPPA